MEEESFTDISLRPLDLLDIDAFMEWAVDDKVAHFCTWEPYTSKEDGINFIRNIVLPHQWYRAICIDNRPIGSITVTPNSGSGDRCRGELGYVLAFKYWGKGIGTQAVKMVAETIFDELPHLERLEALVDVENLASQRVLEKAGFKREGVLRKYMIIKGSTRGEPYTSKEKGLEYIKNKVLPHPWYKAICLDNRPIGTISVTENSGSERCRSELGYVLASKYWGKGIATRAVKMVAETIFNEWPHLERLEALVDVENVGSQKVLQKAGFLKEGVLRKYFIQMGKARDMVMFSLLSTDPRI